MSSNIIDEPTIRRRSFPEGVILQVPSEYIIGMSEEGRPLLDTQKIFQDGLLYASQDWIKPWKIIKAQQYNTGDTAIYHNPIPLVYLAKVDGRIIFVVGDGHHRTADAIINGLPIVAELDNETFNLTEEDLGNPLKAQIKCAKYGIEGIWPFSDFIDAFGTVEPQTKEESKVAHKIDYNRKPFSA
jgi:hypothetical protein